MEWKKNIFLFKFYFNVIYYFVQCFIVFLVRVQTGKRFNTSYFLTKFNQLSVTKNQSYKVQLPSVKRNKKAVEIMNTAHLKKFKIVPKMS